MSNNTNAINSNGQNSDNVNLQTIETIETVVTLSRPSENEFKSYSHNQKWKLYNDLFTENINLNSMLLRINDENNILRNNSNKVMTTNYNLSNEVYQLKLKNELLEERLKDQDKLNKKIEELIQENTDLRKRISEQNDKIDALENYIVNQDIKIEALEKSNDSLQKEVTNQKTEIVALKKNNDSLQKEVTDQKTEIVALKDDMNEMKTRDNPITIREAMTILEKHIMFEILKGSKTKMRNIKSAHNLFNDNMFITECNDYMKKYGITQYHIDLIGDLKENGNYAVHANRPSIERSEWNNLIMQSLDDPNDSDDIKAVGDILNLFEKYSPAPQSGDWKLKRIKV